jgi:1-acyl-sn-glycerol-3-phosphate acyltransferase
MMENTVSNAFIPARESALFIFFFKYYLKWLYKRRFRGVYLRNDYQTPSDSTIYYLNHHYWWDGLTPLLLSEFIFNQKARAIMDEKQLMKHPFFRKIGVFSINLEDSKKTIATLRYAIESLKRPNSCLFIYPQGEFFPLNKASNGFKKGLSWLSKKASGSEVVPIAQWIDYRKGDKPELWIHVGPALDQNQIEDNSFEQILEAMLQPLINFSIEDFDGWRALIGNLPGNRKQ